MADDQQQNNQNPAAGSNVDDQLEAEIEAALGDMSVEDMLDFADRPASSVRAEREFKRGRVVNVYKDQVFVEFGPKSQGMCPLAQFDEPPAAGQEMEFVVERFDKNEGMLILSREGAVQKAAWESLEEGQSIEARCTGVNKGGLEMEVANHKAFMPAGQVDLRHIEDLSVFIGEKMPCEILELDKKRGRIILSRRSHMEAERAHLRDKLLDELQEGDTAQAVIRSIQPFGAFADLGGVDGLIHISDLSYQRVKHPSEVVKEGQQVEVKILKIDRDADPVRIGLGLKQTMQDPYESKAGELAEGSEATGRVTKLMPFGAFVELAPGVEGLIHISELSHERVAKVSSVVQEGEIVTVKVLAVDHAQRRISLSLKAMKAQQERDNFNRGEDPEMRKLKAQLNAKFGDNLKGGLW